MNASDVLINEHCVIKRILGCLTAATNQAKAGEKLDGDSFRRMVEFFQQFADRCHHGKEEARLFPLLRQRGVGCGPGSISILLDEHEQGRAHVRAMADSRHSGPLLVDRPLLDTRSWKLSVMPAAHLILQQPWR